MGTDLVKGELSSGWWNLGKGVTVLGGDAGWSWLGANPVRGVERRSFFGVIVSITNK